MCKAVFASLAGIRKLIGLGDGCTGNEVEAKVGKIEFEFPNLVYVLLNIFVNGDRHNGHFPRCQCGI